MSFQKPACGWRSAGSVLVLLVVAVFGQAVWFPFVTVDDPEYVTANPQVLGGLTISGMQWAFGSFGYGANWIPLTWLSLQCDVSLFGVGPAGFHFSNILLHALNAFLVFQLLRKVTGRCGESLLAAALFAVHPLRAESVVWIAERKDVLSTAFGLAAICTYLSGLSRPGGLKSKAAWLLALCSLLSKQMFVTLPILMALAEWWRTTELRATPFGRHGIVRRLGPFVVICSAFALVAFAAQRAGGGTRSLNSYPLSVRLGNACISVVTYIAQTVWPVGLSVYYPHAGALDGPVVWGAAGVVVGVSVVAILRRRRWPHLFFGWSWYLCSLLPVLGIVQIGDQARADRYTYVPSIGLVAIAVWSFSPMLSHSRTKSFCRSLVLGSVLACAAAGYRQCRIWNSSEALLTHSASVTTRNWFVETALASAVMQDPSRLDEAETLLRRSIGWKPDYSLAYYSLGLVLSQRGQLMEANEHFQRCSQLSPNRLEPRILVAINLVTLGDRESAIRELGSLRQWEQQMSPETRSLYQVALRFVSKPRGGP